MKMRLHTKVTLIAALVAMPFAISGGCIWRDGVAAVQSSDRSFYYYDYLGTQAYLLFGFPLTLIAMHVLPGFGFDDHWWGIPTLSALVILQWIIWANLAVWIGRKIMRNQETTRTSQQSLRGDSENRAEDGTVPGAPQG